MASVTWLPFLLPVGFFAIRFRCLLPAISDRLRFYRFLLACIETRLGILRGTSVGGEHVAHLVCMARKESVECVEVEFLPSATDGGEHTFTSGMGDQRAPLPVPLANLLFKFLFLRFEFGEFRLLFLDTLLEILNGSHGSSFLLDGMANKTFQGGRKAKNTWLAGKVKCGRCGYALMSVGNPTGVQYLRCSKRADSKSCDGCGTLRTREFERFLYGEMVKKLSEFQTLTAKRETVNPKLTALNMELARVEDEIEKLLNTLTGANAVLLSYANSKIEELDTRRQALTKEIAALSAETMSPEQIERLSVYLNQWEEIDFEDRRQVADGLISQIRATDEHVSIEWKI